jgi:intracellular sulfur oxidation DsrE/DsrF family protein
MGKAGVISSLRNLIKSPESVAVAVVASAATNL